MRELTALRLSLPLDQGWIRNIGWLPVGSSELHLCSHSLALAVRFQAARPHLGFLVDPRYLGRPQIDSHFKWQAGYIPLAVRVHPFQLRDAGGDPLDELMLPADSPHVGPAGPIEIAHGARLNPQLIAIHKLLATLAAGQASFATALDQLMIANLLVPLQLPATQDGAAPRATGEPSYFTVDHQRFAALPNGALAAMARHDFRTIDIAVATVFSQRFLARGVLPDARPSERSAAPSLDLQIQQLIHVDTFPLALDDGLLFHPEDLVAEPGGERHDGPASTLPK
ncbi:SapC family protein [Rhodoplanes roseus]|nr:SapC family protein [Rhodoplanes roseus]